MATELRIYRTLSDNCGALLRDAATGRVAVIDVADAGETLAAASAAGWGITDIFITHEHADHIAGVAAVKAATGARVVGPAEAAAAPLDVIVGEGAQVELGTTRFTIWAAPGHSPGHLIWHAPSDALAFVGDVLFVMGCGRLFSDTGEKMWAALCRLAALPDETRLVTGHDYTFANARFARAVDPDNAALAARAADAERRAAAGNFFALTTIGEEKATNPFLRAIDPALQARVGAHDAQATFIALRQMKNSFRG
jgi:hydroxyacylglutathione hydrolase